MVDVSRFYEELINNKIDFFTGVPDSLLKSFCAYVKDNTTKERNIITANEGGSIALACGHYLATGNIGLVYMQNSGIGNAINPLASLSDELVYNIPILLMVGFRGEPGKKDEPQHKKQGLITLELLEILGIKYEIIEKEDSTERAIEKLNVALNYMKETKKVFGLVIKKEGFEEYVLQNKTPNKYSLKREEAIEFILENIKEDTAIVSTTGMASRELFELREKREEGHEKDFLTVGSMGHASHIALGIALNSKKDVITIDGDGAFLMHMGGAAIIGELASSNYTHIILNNGAHDSVGGQDTLGFSMDISKIAKGCGYKKVYVCENKVDIHEGLLDRRNIEGPCLIEIKINKGGRGDLGRPTKTPIENKDSFMRFLREV